MISRFWILRCAILLMSVAGLGDLRAEPDYADWNALLAKYYNPALGMDYKNLKKNDSERLQALRRKMAQVDVARLNTKEQLAYWINLYNLSVVGVVVDHYPVKSIRDISSDPIIRLNVFKKKMTPFGDGKISLDDIEHERIRNGFKDPRIHFAINCAARSCPPIRTEAFAGGRLDAQLDEQARTFLNGPNGAVFQKKGDALVIQTTKIMDWFGKDFDTWGGGKVTFIQKYLSPDKQKAIDQAKGKVKVDYADYDWSLNEWVRP